MKIFRGGCTTSFDQENKRKGGNESQRVPLSLLFNYSASPFYLSFIYTLFYRMNRSEFELEVEIPILFERIRFEIW